MSCSRAATAASAAASHGHLLVLQHKGGRHLAWFASAWQGACAVPKCWRAFMLLHGDIHKQMLQSVPDQSQIAIAAGEALLPRQA